MAAIVGERIITVRATILAEVADADGTLTNDIVRPSVLVGHLEVNRCRHVFNLVVELLVPDRCLSCFIFDGGLVDLCSIDGKLAKWIHIADHLGIAC